MEPWLQQIAKSAQNIIYAGNKKMLQVARKEGRELGRHRLEPFVRFGRHRPITRREDN